MLRHVGKRSPYPGTYLAGLWSSDVFVELIWFRRSANLGDLSRPKHYRAPSWSWAAVEGPIDFVSNAMNARFAEEAVIIHASCIPSSGNIYGPYKSGLIRLKTRILKLNLHFRPQPIHRYGELRDEEGIYGYNLSRQSGNGVIQLMADYDLTDGIAGHDPSSAGSLGEVFAARMGTISLAENTLRSFSLVLRKKKWRSVFERIGLVYQDFATDCQEEDWFSGVHPSVVEIV
jgi:hypothetical protein